MKQFNKWLHRELARVVPLLHGLNRSGWLRTSRHPDGRLAISRPNTAAEAMSKCPSRIEPDLWLKFLGTVFDGGQPTGVRVLSGALRDGLKVYAPTASEFEALCNVDVSIPFADYRQPFDTFAVIVPDGWFPEKVTTASGGETESPVACFLNLDLDIQWMSHCTVSFGNHDVCGDYSTTTTIAVEDYLGRLPSSSEYRGPAHRLVLRAAMNAALLLTTYGTRSLGFANGEYAARLQKTLANKKAPDAAKEASRSALALIPKVYGFEQHVRLFDAEPQSAHSSDGDPDRTCRPHWRRGHWANVACGMGRGERKLVFRRPVLVNSHTFAGDPANTFVTMSTSPKGRGRRSTILSHPGLLVSTGGASHAG